MAVDMHLLMMGWATALWRACWQGGLALLLVWVVCRGWQSMPPGLRVWLWRLAYLKLLLALLWGGGIPLAVLPSGHWASATESPSPTAVISNPAAPSSSASDTGANPAQPPTTPVSADPTPAHVFPAAPTTHSWHWSNVLPYLAIFWLLGVVWGVLRLLLAVRQVRRLCREARGVFDEEQLRLRVQVLKQMGLSRAPMLLVHPSEGPLLLGTFHQVIVVPARLLEGDDEALSLVLAHELAHARQFDILWGWLPALVKALFFFHPLVYPMQQEYRLAQEIACDALALDGTGAAPKAFGAMLLESATHRARYRPVPEAVGILESFQTLRRRLSAMHTSHTRSLRQRVLAGVLAGLFALLLFPWQLSAVSTHMGTLPMTDSTRNDQAFSFQEFGTKPPPLPAEPATLAEAQAAYSRENQQLVVKEESDRYLQIADAFDSYGWCVRCADECDEIIQRFPNNLSLVIMAQLKKARAQAELKHWAEAYTLIDSVDTNYQDIHTPGRHGIPINAEAHLCAMDSKIACLSCEGKYRDAAAVNDQHIADFLILPNSTTKNYASTNKEYMDWISSHDKKYEEGIEWMMNVEMNAHSAILLYYAGDYPAALARYTAIITFINANPIPEKLGGPTDWYYLYKQRYLFPISIAMCQMKMAHYHDALLIYRDIERTLNNPDPLRHTFFTMNGNSKITGNSIAASYFIKCDLQLRLAECLIALGEKQQAQQALSIAATQLKDKRFQVTDTSVVDGQLYNEVYRSLYNHGYMINGRPVNYNWINELQSVTLPALQREIEHMH